ncbi:hypothetical protein [Niallia sp. FSL W8-0635]|uniref:hypothetical protein n=1 Tax=Niallia sp. FSL W8-0635 TaxID=2975337 RepID=UPI0009D26F3A|nr:Uncharacterised protein [Mycobacteroides abscessus subsp. abscessus]HEO8418407.1 hypothetical protein [Yersinia enterocolitica]
MDRFAFNEFAKERIIQSVITIRGNRYPSFSLKYPAFYYFYFDDLSIKIKRNTAFLFIQKKKFISEINYKEISRVKISIIQKLTNVMHVPTKVLQAEIILFLKYGEIYHLDCESIGVFPALINQLQKKKIKIDDPLDIIELLSKKETEEEAIDYVRETIEEVAGKKGIELLRVTIHPS